MRCIQSPNTCHETCEPSDKSTFRAMTMNQIRSFPQDNSDSKDQGHQVFQGIQGTIHRNGIFLHLMSMSNYRFMLIVLPADNDEIKAIGNIHNRISDIFIDATFHVADMQYLHHKSQLPYFRLLTKENTVFNISIPKYDKTAAIRAFFRPWISRRTDFLSFIISLTISS